METALFGVAGALLGIVLGAGLQEWRARNDEQRTIRAERRQRIAEHQLRRLADARALMRGATHFMAAWSLDEPGEQQQAEQRLSDIHGDASLVGDNDAIVRWCNAREAIRALGKGGLGPEEAPLFQELMESAIDCHAALDRQEQRVLNGDPMLAIGKRGRDALADVLPSLQI